jgi:hypothetical protein
VVRVRSGNDFTMPSQKASPKPANLEAPPRAIRALVSRRIANNSQIFYYLLVHLIEDLG